MDRWMDGQMDRYTDTQTDRDFTGCPMVKTLHFHYNKCEFDPWLGD